MKKIILFCFLTFAFRLVDAQTSAMPTVVQPSPNAASLGKYGDIPVGYHTGTVNVSVPIYEVKEGPITLPISLGYHTAGIRVSEVSSWAGLGWALNSGGVITRTVQHVPDEGPLKMKNLPAPYLAMTSGYYTDGYILPEQHTFDSYGHNGFTDPQEAHNDRIHVNAAAGNVDCEPDIFFYNFGGYSGKFFFKVEKNNLNQLVRTPVFIPESDIRVDVAFETVAVPTHITNQTESRQTFTRFIITTPDGFKYYFGGGFGSTDETAVEYTGSESYKKLTYEFSDNVKLLPTSWYLTRILSPDGHTIDLEYTPDLYSFFDLAQERCWGGIEFQDISSQMITRTAINGKRLSRIITRKEEVSFVANTVRDDLGDYENTGGTEQISNRTSKKLDRIEVKLLGGSSVKAFDFYHSYFDCLDGKLPDFLEHSSQSERDYFITDKKRLKLDSVVERSGDLTISKPSYVFKYYETNPYGDTVRLPRRMSYQQDHWGYYNGRSENNTLIGFNADKRTSNRTASQEFNKVGVLTSVQYPTGAKSIFDFESHEAYGVVQQTDTIFNRGTIYEASTFVFPDGPNDVIVPFQVDSLPSLPPPGSPCAVIHRGCRELSITVSIMGGDPRPVEARYDLDYLPYYNRIIAGVYNASDSSLVRYFYVGDLDKANETDTPWPTCCFHNDEKYIQWGKDFFIDLPAGNYYLKSSRIWEPKITDTSKTVLFTSRISLWLPAGRDSSYQAPPTVGLSKVGGLRVKRITNVDHQNIVSRRDFSYPPTGGKLYGMPAYFYEVRGSNNRWWDMFDLEEFETQTWSSSSILPMQSSQGSHIGYEYVNESQTGNGLTRYSYDIAYREFPMNDPYFNGNSFNYNASYRYFNYPPYPAPFYLERGNLLSQEHFNEAGDKVYSKQTQYETKNYEIVGHASKVEFIVGSDPGANSMGARYGDLSTYTNYPIFTGTSRLLKEIETTFEPNGDSISLVKEYKYESNKHLQATEIKKILSNSIELDKLIYPLDYGAITTEDGGIKNLIENHIIGVPIEQYKVVEDLNNSNAYVTGGTISTFKSSGAPQPDKIRSLVPSQPIPLNSFIRSNTTSGTFSPDSRYQDQISFYNYLAGNLQEVGKKDDIHLSYIWGYNSSLPIAEIKNSTAAGAIYTSFEEETTNVSSDSKTGAKSYAATFPVAFTETGGSFRLTYWKKEGANDWRLEQEVITQPKTIGGSGILIDEVRLCPVGAQMTTYTYHPIFGVTTVTDVNNRITYFEYDKLGRLSIVRDHNKKIVKTYSYQYARGN